MTSNIAIHLIVFLIFMDYVINSDYYPGLMGKTDRDIVYRLLHHYVTKHEDDVTPTTSENGENIAWRFNNRNRAVFVSKEMSRVLSNLALTSQEISVYFRLRIPQENIGSILSLTIKDFSVLEIEISMRSKELRLRYISGKQVTTQAISLPSFSSNWNLFSFSVRQDNVALFYHNCQLLDKRDLKPGFFESLRLLSNHLAKLWIFQRNADSHYSVGSIEYLDVIFQNNNNQNYCPAKIIDYLKTSEFKEFLDSHQRLTQTVHQLTQKLAKTEKKLAELSNCKCSLKGCNHDNRSYDHLQSVPSADKCVQCQCKAGNVFCNHLFCDELSCEDSVIDEDACCPRCPHECIFNGQVYQHGYVLKPKRCMSCICKDGRMSCHHRAVKSCPKLACPRQHKVLGPDECCLVCADSDFCIDKSLCDLNATCINLKTTHACLCNPGFYLHQDRCIDVNECESYGGEHGHHCSQNSFCLNTIGSYQCKCLQGFTPSSMFTCRAYNVCIGDGDAIKGCDVNARCIRSADTFVCRCLSGYTGDGFKCQPLCEGNCGGVGLCVGVNECQCPSGLAGFNCLLDIDECLIKPDICAANATCTNTYASFSCSCRPGYFRTKVSDQLGTSCQDVNECNEDLHGFVEETTLCPPPLSCRNLAGGYRCECPSHLPSCSTFATDCRMGSRLIANNTKWRSTIDFCLFYICINGVIEEVKETANDVNSSCLSYPSGLPMRHCQRLQDQCQTCFCYKGLSDCSPVKCEPISWSCERVHWNGCCPFCLHDLLNDACIVQSHLQQNIPIPYYDSLFQPAGATQQGQVIHIKRLLQNSQPNHVKPNIVQPNVAAQPVTFQPNYFVEHKFLIRSSDGIQLSDIVESTNMSEFRIPSYTALECTKVRQMFTKLCSTVDQQCLTKTLYYNLTNKMLTSIDSYFSPYLNSNTNEPIQRTTRHFDSKSIDNG